MQRGAGCRFENFAGSGTSRKASSIGGQRKLKAGRQERNKPSVQGRAASFALVSEDGIEMPAGLELVLQDGRRLR
jgi:hypothetical protein